MKYKKQILLIFALIATLPMFAQHRVINLFEKDTIYVSTSHVVYIDARKINVVEMDYNIPYITVGKTQSDVTKMIARENFSQRTPNAFPLAFITGDQTIIKMIKYRDVIENHLYCFEQTEPVKSNIEIAPETTDTTIFISEEEVAKHRSNCYMPFNKNGIEAVLGLVENDDNNYYFTIKVTNKGNKPFRFDYSCVTLQKSNRRVKNATSQVKTVDCEIINKCTLHKSQQEWLTIKTPKINVNEGSFLYLEIFDDESEYHKEDVRTIFFNIPFEILNKSTNR